MSASVRFAPLPPSTPKRVGAVTTTLSDGVGVGVGVIVTGFKSGAILGDCPHSGPGTPSLIPYGSNDAAASVTAFGSLMILRSVVSPISPAKVLVKLSASAVAAVPFSDGSVSCVFPVPGL